MLKKLGFCMGTPQCGHFFAFHRQMASQKKAHDDRQPPRHATELETVILRGVFETFVHFLL